MTPEYRGMSYEAASRELTRLVTVAHITGYINGARVTELQIIMKERKRDMETGQRRYSGDFSGMAPPPPPAQQGMAKRPVPPMLVEAGKAQVGDTVKLAGVVTCIPDSITLHVLLPGNMYDTCIPRAAIVSVTPKALAVGDVVTWGAKESRGTIRAIVGDRAWVWLPHLGGGYDHVQPLLGMVRA